MSERQEFHAPSVAEAIDKASASLGIDRDELRLEVLDEGSTGFLGIGARDARILVEAPSPPTQNYTPTPEMAEAPTVPETEDSTPTEDYFEDIETVEESDTKPEVSSEDLVVAVDDLMTAIIAKMGLDATVDAYDAGEVITVDVATKQAGLFIGHKGETIDAIQYLLNVAIYKSYPFSKRIVVDSEGYRQRRVEALQGMAHRTARRASREERPLNLPAMSAAERRVVHLFLKDNPNVTTSSEGEEDDRHVVVSPV